MPVTKFYNKTRMPVLLLAEDGDTLLLPVGAHSVPSKFTWSTPKGVSYDKPVEVNPVEPAAQASLAFPDMVSPPAAPAPEPAIRVPTKTK